MAADDRDQLAKLASALALRRESIFEAWFRAVTGDEKLTTIASLPSPQLRDHLPSLLEDFERLLRAKKGASTDLADEQGDAAAHGLHRWQQGFNFSEVARELGRLNECVLAELDRCSQRDPELTAATLAEARAIWARMFSVAVESSISQYFKLQKLESAGQLAELEEALRSVRELESQHGMLWQQAAHDLRGNLSVVSTTAAVLTHRDSPSEVREKLLSALDRNVRALHGLLEDVTGLARLQAGLEVRQIVAMDAALLLQGLGEGLQLSAEERGLRLAMHGPAPFLVAGDPVKIRRIVQNLAINAIKYTPQGSVRLTWGECAPPDVARWSIEVRDTGPGLRGGPSGPLADALETATDHAREAQTERAAGDVPHLPPAGSEIPDAAAARTRAAGSAGEGLGLAIVKRLCELLDATVEMDANVGQGTSFRVLLPKHYPEQGG